MSKRKAAGRPRTPRPRDNTITVRLDDETMDRARAAATREDRPLAVMVRRLIVAGLELYTPTVATETGT